MNNKPICPCDRFVFPLVITNPPGRTSIAYRVGDFTAFRHALLQRPRRGEVELVNWRPSATQDLAVQMAEWWAYLADILTFYNERIANQDYLPTADPPESINRLIRVLGYRPRPGIGATGTLAALLSKPVSITLPRGFQVQSKPGPGQQPQIFELDADTPVNPPDVLGALPAPNAVSAVSVISSIDGNDSVLLRGVISGLKPEDELLVLETAPKTSSPEWALATVVAIQKEKATDGTTNTRVVFNGSLGLAASHFRLLKSARSAHVWQYPAATVIDGKKVDLESTIRDIKVGDLVLFEVPGSASISELVRVTSYAEIVWYANPKDYPTNPKPDPTLPPKPSDVIPIPIPHTHLEFAPGLAKILDKDRATVLVRFAWQDAGTVIEPPVSRVVGNQLLLTGDASPSFAVGDQHDVLIEGSDGNGIKVVASIATGNASGLGLATSIASSANLIPPVRVLFDLLSVSRGKTVPNEILGSGPATQAGQEFALKNSPLTYLQKVPATSGDQYGSTLQVWVNRVQWQEVASFYKQLANAQIFVTREEENNQTHVMFGDGINGARLPTGTNNVVATYRYGSGAQSPAAGSLTVILQPQPNLKAIRNPVAVGGGADPDPPDQIRRYAPQSVLTFGRAISADDYETIAAQAPGVARARSHWTWDPDQQRALVTIYVGDDQTAVDSAKAALALAGDPNRPVTVRLAVALPISLNLTVLTDSRYLPADVKNNVIAALVDAQKGLFGTGVMGIGQSIYLSQIYRACLKVPGAVGVHSVKLARKPASLSTRLRSRRVPFAVKIFHEEVPFDPGEDRFCQLSPSDLAVSTEVAANAA